jgi:4-hydroxy 2-oxovalerate aldolase
MYRPEIKVLDCTIRDGGLMNEWKFEKPFVKEVFEACVRAGVDYCELGYRVDKKMFSPKDFGPWRFCDEEDLRDVAYKCDTKIAIMCDVGRTDYAAFLPAEESIVDMVRVATYVPDIDKAIHLCNHVRDLGYKVTLNIMAVSQVLELDLDEALEQVAQTDCDALYIVDSFGYFYSEQIDWLAAKYMSKVPNKTIGVHCHNQQQLAFANTIEGIIKGCNYVDASVFGIGRAAGNCPLELLLGFLKNPKFDVRPILDLIQKHFIDMKKELRWGYEIPYAVTGMLNKHPRAAMAFLKGVHGSTFSEFHDQMLNVED